MTLTQLFNLALACYFAALVSAVIQLFGKRRFFDVVALVLLLGGLRCANGLSGHALGGSRARPL
jgi:hypothetical protein